MKISWFQKYFRFFFYNTKTSKCVVYCIYDLKLYSGVFYYSHFPSCLIIHDIKKVSKRKFQLKILLYKNLSDFKNIQVSSHLHHECFLFEIFLKSKKLFTKWICDLKICCLLYLWSENVLWCLLLLTFSILPYYLWHQEGWTIEKKRLREN